MRLFVPTTVGFRSRDRLGQRLLALFAFFLVLAVITVIIAFVFQYMMITYEGEGHSFVNGLYWTITTMTTLGFGDITFTSHVGRLFTGLVTLLGLVLYGILLPFAVIAVFFGPWLQSRLRYRPRTRLPRTLAGHVIICGWDSVTETLVKKLTSAGVPYVVLAAEVDESRRLDEEGVNVVQGRFSDVEVLKRVRVEAARMVIANMSDPDNANLVLTTASVASTPVTAVVTEPERKELMRIAGAAHIVALREVLGNYLAVRATTRGAAGHVVDSLGELLFAEIPSHGTPFIGQSLKETGIRRKTGVSVIGIWERGHFSLPEPDTVITEGMVMLLVGAQANLEALERIIGAQVSEDLIVILGCGTVGSAAAAFLDQSSHVPYAVVDRLLLADCQGPEYIQGDASRTSVLEEAGIMRAGGLIVTTNDDGVNVFLTLACRHLNPHIRIVARANRAENVAQFYAAGADFVVSHSSVGANILANMIEGRQTVFLTEGVHIFWRQVPPALVGETLAESQLRSLTGATVVAIQGADNGVTLDLSPETVFESGSTLILVGAPQSEELFSKRFALGSSSR